MIINQNIPTELLTPYQLWQLKTYSNIAADNYTHHMVDDEFENGLQQYIEAQQWVEHNAEMQLLTN